MKRIFGKKAAAAAIAVLFSVSLVCTGCSDGGSSGGDDSGGTSGGETGGGTEKPTIADGTYCDGMLTVENGIVTKCDPSATGTIEIPEGVTAISYNAFSNLNDCNSLTSIIIPASVERLWADPRNENAHNDPGMIFAGFSKLQITVNENNTVYSSDNGILYNKNKTTLYAYPSASGNIIIRKGVTAIGESAFKSCTSLTKVTIPEGVTKIGTVTFWDCTSLTDVTIPKSVTSIGSFAFSSCTNLTSVTISGSVTEIGISVFRFCHNLKTIYVANKDEIAKWTEEKIGKSGITVEVKK